MGFQNEINDKIMSEVVTLQKSLDGTVNWRVLVLDQLGMRIISSCCKMTEICWQGIALVENLLRNREPLPLEAIYLITPSACSIEKLMNDFKKPNKKTYAAAHVYFTETCPDDIFKKLKKGKIGRFIKTLKELNIAFLPHEKQVFTLDSRETFAFYYNPKCISSRNENIERMAEQISTLCWNLNEYPMIRFRSAFERNVELAKLLQIRLDCYKANNPLMGDDPHKRHSQLIIIDRGFDCTSPFLHELTYQAMTYDLLDIDNDVYVYQTTKDVKKEVILDESDDVWVEQRHQHIADVSKNIPQLLKEFEKKNSRTQENNLRDLSEQIKKMPQYRKELAKLSAHMQIGSDCMTHYQKSIKELCGMEQDLALGTDADGKPIKEYLKQLGTIIMNPDVSKFQKLRLIALYIMRKNGVTEEYLAKVLSHAKLTKQDLQAVFNMAHLGVNIVGSNFPKVDIMPRKERKTYVYKESRWVPVIKDVMENAIENKLGENYYPFLTDRRPPAKGDSIPQSARKGIHKYKDAHRHVSRLFVFIIGGVTYSEMRCAYEVTKAMENWEVIIGSSHIITPKSFVADLTYLLTDV